MQQHWLTILNEDYGTTSIIQVWKMTKAIESRVFPKIYDIMISAVRQHRLNRHAKQPSSLLLGFL